MTKAGEIPVLYESEDVLVVDKPAGQLTIPGRGTEEGPDVHAALEKLRGERLWVVHRLDRGTSGALCFARNADSHRHLSQAFEAGRVGKRYLALVQGAIRSPMGEIDRALIARGQVLGPRGQTCALARLQTRMARHRIVGPRPLRAMACGQVSDPVRAEGHVDHGQSGGGGDQAVRVVRTDEQRVPDQ